MIYKCTFKKNTIHICVTSQNMIHKFKTWFTFIFYIYKLICIWKSPDIFVDCLCFWLFLQVLVTNIKCFDLQKQCSLFNKIIILQYSYIHYSDSHCVRQYLYSVMPFMPNNSESLMLKIKNKIKHNTLMSLFIVTSPNQATMKSNTFIEIWVIYKHFEYVNVWIVFCEYNHFGSSLIPQQPTSGELIWANKHHLSWRELTLFI